MKLASILCLIASLAAAEQFAVVINQPGQADGLALDGVPVMSLAGEQRGNAWVIGREGPARDAFNRLEAAGCVPNQFPALVELDSGGAWIATDAAIANRTNLLALHIAEINVPVAQYRSLQFYGCAGVALPATDGHHYQPEYDPDSDEWFGVERGSEWVTDLAYTNNRASRMTIRRTHRNRIAAIEEDLNQVELQIVSTNWTDVVLTNVIVTSGVWTNAAQRSTMVAIKDALQAIKANESNLKIAVRNLKQAAEKLRREVR